MIVLRSALFNVAFFGWTAVCSIMFLPMLILPRAVLGRSVKVWAKGVGWLLEYVTGVRVDVRGRENIPDGPIIIASKHQSAWETIMFHLLVPSPAYVFKKELLRIPFYGWCVSKVGSIPVDRKAGASALKSLTRHARAALERGQQIVIFPEGTRSAPGSRHPYLPGVAALYARLKVPVVPVALNTGLFWGRRRFLKQPGCIVVQFLPAIGPELDRRRFMAELEDRIETASTALIGPPLDNFVDNSVDNNP